jgi:L-alanine-DL-glutamate epimerase-like enolase superfamily enzyme
MVDMALFDLMAKHAQLPLYKLLGGYRHSISTSITIGIVSIEDTLKQAQAFLKDNFTIIKLKGGIDLNQDVEKIIKLREQFGTKFKLRFDANQGYTPDQTIDFIKLTKSSKIELLEQPTSPENESLLDHKIHHQIDIPVMADESIHNLKDAFKLAKNDMIDMVNIKLMKVGGILESQRINAVAKASGMAVMVGCIDECALGISAGLHFSLSAPNVEFADLDGHLDLINDPFKDLFTLKNGILYPSQEAGLGKINL